MVRIYPTPSFQLHALNQYHILLSHPTWAEELRKGFLWLRSQSKVKGALADFSKIMRMLLQGKCLEIQENRLELRRQGGGGSRRAAVTMCCVQVAEAEQENHQGGNIAQPEDCLFCTHDYLLHAWLFPGRSTFTTVTGDEIKMPYCYLLIRLQERLTVVQILRSVSRTLARSVLVEVPL